MANNYIKLGNEDLIDLRSDTVEAGKMLQGTTAHDKSGTLISGSIQSGNVSLTLTPSNLSPSTSPNKYVTSASASLDYSSLTAEAATVQSGKTFIGKNGVGTGSLVAASVQTGNIRPDTTSSCTITGLTGTPSNLMMVHNNTSGSGSYVMYLYYINGSAVQMARNGSNLYKRTNASVSFDSSTGKCTITLASDSFRRQNNGDTYTWVVW